MKKLKKFSTYYSRLSKALMSDADLIVQFLMQCDADGINEVMQYYFKEHWGEFKAFWEQSGEHIDWITFSLAPHNASWFILYVFNEHPEVRTQLMHDYHQTDEEGLT